jgi:glycosyltransferase involved in cell wall biosynthesis
MNLSEVTVVILTRNEEPNIQRCLDGVSWAAKVVVVDSESTDITCSVCQRFGNTSIAGRQFDNHTDQWDFGLNQATTPWVLCLDADYVCPASLPQEIASLPEGVDGYYAGFRYLINGKPLRGTLYPPRVCLFRKDRLRYIADGHTQLLDVRDAKLGHLKSVIDHDDRKPLSRWLSSQSKYAVLEADKLLSTDKTQLGWKDRLRLKIVLAPALTVVYCLFWKRLILDGWPGIFYTLQRAYAELLLSLELLDRKLRGTESSVGSRQSPGNRE